MEDIKDVLVTCCDNVVTITGKQIRRGIGHMKETAGMVLVGCPHCSSALKMAPDMPLSDGVFSKWLVENEDDDSWLPCIKMLDSRMEDMPAGSVNEGGIIKYRPGNGSRLLDRYQYMMAHGIDPEMAMKNNPAMGGRPVRLG